MQGLLEGCDHLAGLPLLVRVQRGPAQGERGGHADLPAEPLHLVRVEREVFQARLAQVAREDVPHWEWVEPGAEPGHASLATLIDRFARARAATLDHLLSLHPEGWARTGIHATYGRLDVAALLGIAVEHDADHLAELERRAA